MHRVCVLFLFLFSFHFAFAEIENQEIDPSRMVVRIDNASASIFSPQPTRSHGTGFIVDFVDGKAVVFTNRHVISSHAFHAQTLNVSIRTDTVVHETVDAKLVYESQIHDFAVLEFSLDQLKRTRNRIQKAHIPEPDSYFYGLEKQFHNSQRIDVFALGNPFESNDVVTFGQVSTIYRNPVMGPFIQTQTPINPGNSGGPLLSAETGEVLGINTLKLLDADNVGFAIPIAPLWEEYKAWRQNPRLGDEKAFYIKPTISSRSDLDRLAASQLIQQHYPEYFDHHKGAIRINATNPNTGLKRGDEIFEVNGEPIGQNIYRLRHLAAQDVTHLKLKVVRDGTVVEVNFPVINNERDRNRVAHDFVYFSGLIFAQMTDLEHWNDASLFPSKVLVLGLVSAPEVHFSAHNYPPLKSILVAVTLDSNVYEINTLLDLKRALRRHPKSKDILLHYHRAIPDEDGIPHLFNGSPLYEMTSTTSIIPVKGLVTPFQFSVHQFMKQFSFSPGRSETWSWQDFVKRDRIPKANCEKILAE